MKGTLPFIEQVYDRKKINDPRENIKMRTFIILVCSILAVTHCHNESVIVIGSKYIRPRQPYTVAFANPFNSNVKLELSLECDGGSYFWKSNSLMLERQSQKIYSYDIPDISESQCFFSVVNDGGSIMVNHEVELLFPMKTLSVFILIDKPIYKPGDVLRFRVVVVDIAMKPANHIETIEIYLEDSDGESIKYWTQGKYHNGIFESSYTLPLDASQGSWALTVMAKDNSVYNEKSMRFEVREYFPPNMVVNVVPSRTLLISDKEISLNITSHSTFGMPVQGIVKVELFTNCGSNAIHSEVGRFYNQYYFTFKLKGNLHPLDHKGYVMFRTTVSVTDEINNMTTIKSKEIPVFLLPYKITLINRAMNYRPGSTILFKLSVQEHNDFPLELQGKSITMITDTNEGDVDAKLDNQGKASFLLSMPNEITNVTISASFEGVIYRNLAVIEGLSMTSTQYLQIFTKNSIIAGRNITFTISSNQYFTKLFYLVTSRGSIIANGHQKFKQRKSYSLKIKLSTDMVPHARLIVYTFKRSQMILDLFEMQFEQFGNKFSYMADMDIYRPNQAFCINVTADDESYVAFQAISQGQEEFVLTKKRVLDDLNDYIGGVYEEVDDTDDGDRQIMQSTGLFLTSNGFALSCGSTHKQSFDLRKTQQTCPKTGPNELSKKETSNNEYPEAWLWRSFIMNNESTYTMTDLVPNKIASWYVTGFTLSPSKGLMLMSAPRKITVGKPFNMVVNFPSSIKRGEVSRIEVNLLNFLDQAVPMDVILFNRRREFEFVDGIPTDAIRHTKSLMMSPHQSKSITFLIKANNLEKIVVQIEAISELASDGLERVLHVDPESLLHEKTEERFIDFKGNDKLNFEIGITNPRDAVLKITKIYLTIDPLPTPSMVQSLESLFAEPTGSTEFDLLTFISNVVVLEYHKESGNTSPAIEQHATDYLNSGYRNHLNYKHVNGAFGYWNNTKGKPSVFMTALVANVFSLASKHITVDFYVVIRAMIWISGKQKPNGCFQEDGETVYPPIQDFFSSAALTAFIVATVKESEKIASQFSTIAEKGSKCLADKFDSLDKMHDIALATYALSLTKHDKCKEAINKLKKKSIVDNDQQYWGADMNTETTGYALLAYLANDFVIDSMPTMQWLSKQLFSIEQFADVLRSFVAFKALGKMAKIINKNDYRLVINANMDTYAAPIYSTELKLKNSIKLELPHDVHYLSFNFMGHGFGLLQLKYQYQKIMPSFEIELLVSNATEHYILDLQVCFRYIEHKFLNRTGPILTRINFPSGFVVNDNAVCNSTQRIEKIERDFGDTLLLVYYSSMEKNQICFKVTAHRKYRLVARLPSYVLVTDRDDARKLAIQEYRERELTVCDICDEEDCKAMNC